MKVYKILQNVILIILIFFSFILPQTEKEEISQIKGIVFDKESGDILIGANIAILDSNIGVSSNLLGEYSFDSLGTGQYQLKATYFGYNDLITDTIYVTKDSSKTFNIYLECNLEKEGDCYTPGVDSIFLSYKNLCEKAFGVKDISQISERYRIYVLPSFQHEFMVEIIKNDPNYDILLYLVDTTNITINYDASEIHYVDSIGQNLVEQIDADYINNTLPSLDYPNGYSHLDLSLNDYEPTVKILKYHVKDNILYNLITSNFETFRVDTMISIHHLYKIILDGIIIIFETNINNKVNRFEFHVSEYIDSRYNWIINIVKKLRTIAVN